MRILFVAWRDLAHPQAGGSETLVDRMAAGAQARGHDVTLLCGGPVEDCRPYRVVRNGGTYDQYLTAPLRYARDFRDVDLLVDVHNGVPFFSPVWRRGPVLCLLHHVHTDQWAQHFPPPVARFGQLLEGRAMPLAYRRRRFIVDSASTAEDLARLGVPPERIDTLPIGVDLPGLQRERTEAAAPLFVALGRLVPHKRMDLLLELWERVRPHTGGRLVIAGDGPERERLRAMAGPGVEVLGFVSDEQRLDLLSRAWLLLHPAQHEGWGIAIMEAAAAGTPALGFDVAGVRDAIADGVSGALVRDPDELARRWVELAADDALRARLGEQARRRAATYTWERTVDVFLEAAERTVAEARGGGRWERVVPAAPAAAATPSDAATGTPIEA